MCQGIWKYLLWKKSQGCSVGKRQDSSFYLLLLHFARSFVALDNDSLYRWLRIILHSIRGRWIADSLSNRYMTLYHNHTVDGWAIRSTHRFLIVRWFKQVSIVWSKNVSRETFFALIFFAFFSAFCILRSNRGVQNTKKMPVFCSTNTAAGILLCSFVFLLAVDNGRRLLRLHFVPLRRIILPDARAFKITKLDCFVFFIRRFPARWAGDLPSHLIV